MSKYINKIDGKVICPGCKKEVTFTQILNEETADISEDTKGDSKSLWHRKCLNETEG